MRASRMREPRSDLRQSKARVAGAHLQAVRAANTPFTDALAVSGQKTRQETNRRASKLCVTELRVLGHLVAAEDL